MLERVSYISSVSEGSLASAYFAIKKPRRDVAMLNEAGLMSEPYERFFEQFKTSMAKDYEWPLLWRQLRSLRWFNPSWSARSLAETLSEDYFGSSNFADLGDGEVLGDNPRLLVNTTLYNDGRRFLLSTLPRENSQFDLIAELKRDPRGASLHAKTLDLLQVRGTA